MKKTISVLLSFVIIVMFVGCNSNRHTQIDVPVYTMPDFSYWKENYQKAQAEMRKGHSGNTGYVSGSEIMNFIENIEYGKEVSVRPIDAHYNSSHGVSFVNIEENRSLYVIFYNDFEYVAVYENGIYLDNTPLYQLINSEECKQFFIDSNCYMPLSVSTAIVDKIRGIVNSGDVERLNRKVEPSQKDGSILNIVPGTLKRLEISNVTPVSYNYGEYMAHINVGYDYGGYSTVYYGIVWLDKNFEITAVTLNKTDFEGEITSQYVIGGADYSVYMEKLDNPVNNQFNYQLVGGGYGMGSSGMEWNTSIMRCINGLKLGDMVSINTKDYPYLQTYSILLSESNPNYDVKPLIFSFYDDCQYVVICGCQDEVNWTVCDNHTQGYKVNNPETVRDIFSMKGQYVPADDYKSLEKFADDYMKKTAVSKLNEQSVTDVKIEEGYELQGNITKMTAKAKLNTDGKEKYQIEFVAMYSGKLPNGNNHYLTYKVEMVLAKNGKNWQIETLGIRNY